MRCGRLFVWHWFAWFLCITEADAQPAFEAVLNEDMTSAIASEATDGASLGKRAIKEINSVEVQYDIKQFSYEYLKSIQNILTEHMEELEIHRIGIKQRDNVVDIYMDSGMEEKIEDCLRQNIENFDIAAVRVHIDDSEMNYMATKTVTPYSGNEIKCTLKDTVYTSTIGFHAVDFWGEAGIVTAGHGAPKGSSAKYNGYSLGTSGLHLGNLWLPKRIFLQNCTEQSQENLRSVRFIAVDLHIPPTP